MLLSESKKNMQEAFWEAELQHEQQSFGSMDAEHKCLV
jgi:hypothetical protein